MPQAEAIRTFAINGTNLEQSESSTRKYSAEKSSGESIRQRNSCRKAAPKRSMFRSEICRCISSMPREARVREFPITR